MKKLFYSIKNQLILIFTVGLLFNVVITLTYFEKKQQTENADSIKIAINNITHAIKTTSNTEKDFLLYESINPAFLNLNKVNT